LPKPDCGFWLAGREGQFALALCGVQQARDVLNRFKPTDADASSIRAHARAAEAARVLEEYFTKHLTKDEDHDN
jgi:limonene-1,2-epoxide hydrolase